MLGALGAAGLLSFLMPQLAFAFSGVAILVVMAVVFTDQGGALAHGPAVAQLGPMAPPPFRDRSHEEM